ncbi:uncharacterized protein M437DRAFT_54378, partial [Aureobasidium melanogenum CBS 110374]
HENHRHIPLLPSHLGIPIIFVRQVRLGNHYIALSFLTFFFRTHILPQHVTVGESKSWIACLPHSSTCVQPPPLNIRYLLAAGTIFNRF